MGSHSSGSSKARDSRSRADSEPLEWLFEWCLAWENADFVTCSDEDRNIEIEVLRIQYVLLFSGYSASQKVRVSKLALPPASELFFRQSENVVVLS